MFAVHSRFVTCDAMTPCQAKVRPTLQELPGTYGYLPHLTSVMDNSGQLPPFDFLDFLCLKFDPNNHKAQRLSFCTALQRCDRGNCCGHGPKATTCCSLRTRRLRSVGLRRELAARFTLGWPCLRHRHHIDRRCNSGGVDFGNPNTESKAMPTTWCLFHRPSRLEDRS